ncbi:hypothetical protein [Arenimonas sp.]|uniref:hypothetical protein n=1 Tax=Arenimonas sp. TaxID=1872635 RepID=UPI0039E3B34D
MSDNLPLYTLIHVLLSVVGIVAGLVVVGGFMAGVHFRRWVACFLATTILTNVTGFGFPFVTLLPSHIVATLSLIVLPIAVFALYGKGLAGSWRRVFVVLSVLALYLNVFVLMAQLLQKIPVLAALAPNPQAPAFALSQLFVLVLFVGLGRAAVRGFGNADLAHVA